MKKNEKGLYLGIATIALLFVTLWAVSVLQWPLGVGSLALPLVAVFLLALRLEGIALQPLIKRDWRRIKSKVVGLSIYFLLFLVLLKLLSLFSERHQLFLDSYLFFVLIALLVLSGYFFWADQYEILKADDWLYLGQSVATGKVDGLAKCLPKIGLKAFFIPLMVVWLDGAILELQKLDFFVRGFSGDFAVRLVALGLVFDLFVGTIGYLFTSRLFNADLKVDNGWRSWFFCLLCYPPLNQILSLVFKPSDDIHWQQVFAGQDFLYMVWGGILALLWFGYWWATLCFGVRFSNLSYRGLVDTGPYRYMKHPAYLCKVCYWWLLTVPFVSPLGAWGVAQNFACIAGLSWVYYRRAKEEERFLQGFSEYREYQQRIAGKAVRIRLWPIRSSRSLTPG